MVRLGAVLLVILAACCAAVAADQPTASSEGVYVVAARTVKHQNLSKAEVFDDTVKRVVDYLNASKVIITKDPDREMLRITDEMSVASMANLAKDAGAATLLVLTVDRPTWGWIGLTVTAYDLDGKKLWEESDKEAGGMNGKQAPAKVVEKLKRKLEPRLGQTGLPVSKAG